MRALVAGATGFIGQALCERLVRDGVAVRALVRSAQRTRGLPVDELELHEGDVLEAETLTGAGEGIDVAYYLVHSMGRGSDAGDFEQRELRAAEAFARMCSHGGRPARRLPRRPRREARLQAPAQPSRHRRARSSATGRR